MKIKKEIQEILYTSFQRAGDDLACLLLSHQALYHQEIDNLAQQLDFILKETYSQMEKQIKKLYVK